MRASETAEMIFDNCRIPDSETVWVKLAPGFKQSMKVLDGGRISIYCIRVGYCKRSLRSIGTIFKGRYQFDQPIANFGRKFKLADMATEITAAELLINAACDLKCVDCQ